MKLEKAIRREQKAEGPGQWSVVSGQWSVKREEKTRPLGGLIEAREELD